MRRKLFAFQPALVMLLSSMGQAPCVETAPTIPKEFIRAKGTKFVGSDDQEFIIKGMGFFYHGSPASTIPKRGARFGVSV